jgi:RNA polymerase sigma-70 factor, ECF subfamily
MLRLLPDMKAYGTRQSAGTMRATALPSVMAEPTAAEASTVASGTHADRLARFRAVYDSNYHRILGYVLRRTANRQDAEDAVAETFLTAWRRLEKVPPGNGARPWLYGVARNVLANNRRGERRRVRLRNVLNAEPGSQSLQRGGTDTEVAAAFAGLGDDDRELLALAAWEGLDPGEIATVLGCSRNAARIRLHRARRRLARELEDTTTRMEGA